MHQVAWTFFLRNIVGVFILRYCNIAILRPQTRHIQILKLIFLQYHLSFFKLAKAKKTPDFKQEFFSETATSRELFLKFLLIFFWSKCFFRQNEQGNMGVKYQLSCFAFYKNSFHYGMMMRHHSNQINVVIY